MIQSGYGKEGYRKALRNSKLSTAELGNLLNLFGERGRPKLEELLRDDGCRLKIPKILNGFEIRKAKYSRSWGGLVFGFPGSKTELSTYQAGTPFIREILYPVLDLFNSLGRDKSAPMPCLYLLGARFSDVLLRKFRLLKAVVPHVVVLTEDLLNCINQRGLYGAKNEEKINEKWAQTKLVEQMRKAEGLPIPTSAGGIKSGYIAHELTCFEGTVDPERLDILGYDMKDHSLIAIEIKRPECGKVQLENLFLQGMEHRNWLEENKMAVKFVFEGPRGKKINTNKRVRLILGFYEKEIPPLFNKIKQQALRKDRYLKIDFCKISPPASTNEEIILAPFS